MATLKRKNERIRKEKERIQHEKEGIKKVLHGVLAGVVQEKMKATVVINVIVSCD